MLKTLTLAVVDVETTGVSVTGDRIIEIGVKRIERGAAVRTFETLVNPEQRIPHFIEQLTGIRNDDLEGAPTFRQIADELAAVLDGCVFVAHNVRFDYGLIRNEFARLGRAFTAPCLCSVRLSRLLYPRYHRHGLSEIIARFRLSCERRHRALDDAEVVWGFLQAAHRNRGAGAFHAAVKALLSTPTLPPHLPADMLARLLDGPGVYVFYDQAGHPIYVGKSRSIRARVLSHLSGDYRSGQAMRICQQAARVEAHSTYGELGALLLEAHLIKTIAPLHNQRVRAHRTLVMARRVDGERGYARLLLECRDTQDIRETSEVLGLFRSLRQAKETAADLARAHQLCPKVLGLDRRRGRCISRQLRQCRGACAGIEPPALFNARLETAWGARRLRAWPHAGPVMIREANGDGARGHLFVLDAWRLVRALHIDEAGTRPFLPAQAAFDYDIYKILAAHLARHPQTVTPLDAAQLAQLDEQTVAPCSR